MRMAITVYGILHPPGNQACTIPHQPPPPPPPHQPDGVRGVTKSNPEGDYRSCSDLKLNRLGASRRLAGQHRMFVTAPGGALLDNTNNMCHGLAALRPEVLFEDATVVLEGSHHRCFMARRSAGVVLIIPVPTCLGPQRVTACQSQNIC